MCRCPTTSTAPGPSRKVHVSGGVLIGRRGPRALYVAVGLNGIESESQERICTQCQAVCDLKPERKLLACVHSLLHLCLTELWAAHARSPSALLALLSLSSCSQLLRASCKEAND
eukprot:GGOE01011724.1.p3 GENE.GGOE01011724.1~~GGOE01011724.1.p3  ORF type:complete len:115 (+),score=12.06 GGOE01011724.1:670-1014(+)